MPQTNNHQYKIGLIIFLAAMAIRILFLYLNYGPIAKIPSSAIAAPDGYLTVAESLLAGQGFSQHSASIPFTFTPQAERLPLYPLFIASLVYVFKNYQSVLIAQIILASVIPILGWRISQYFTKHPGVNWAVAIALILEPLSVYFSAILIAEILFTLLFLAALLYFLRYLKNLGYHDIILSGIYLGLATLTRPTVQYLPILFSLFILWQFKNEFSKKIARQLTLFIGIFFLILSPWLYRNYIVFNTSKLSIQPIRNLYMHLVPSAIALERNVSFAEAQKQWLDREEKLGRGLELVYATKNQSVLLEPSWQELKKNPIGLIKSFGITTATFFTHDGYLDILRALGYQKNFDAKISAVALLFNAPLELIKDIRQLITGPGMVIIIGRITWIFISILFVIGFLKYLKNEREKNAGAKIILLTIAYFLATSAIVGLGINARIRSPINPLIFIFAFYGLQKIIGYFKNSRNLLNAKNSDLSVE